MCGLTTEAFSEGITEPVKLRSPNGRVEVIFSLNQMEMPTYEVAYDKRPTIAASPLGVEFKEGGLLSRGTKVTDIQHRSHDEAYTLVVGKLKQARDHYNELAVSLEEKMEPKRKFQIIFRVFDDGAAFRYVIPQQAGIEEFEITAEKSEFHFPADHTCWALLLESFTTNYESEFNKTTLSQIKPDEIVGLPLTIQIDGDLTLALAEANLKDYAGMYLGGVAEVPHALVSRLSPLPEAEGVCVRARAPHGSPWRVLMIGEHPGKLIESTIILNLNEPTALPDTSWIRPGKAAWDWWSGQIATGVNFKTGMNNDTMKHYIDFAAEFGLEYMLIDAGWYTEKAYGEDADLKADITKSVPEIDLLALVSYARERQVGILAWLHWILARDQMDVAFPYYEEIGVKGVKVDFMDRDDQEMVNFYHRVIRKAAEHHLLINLHGAYKPTGLTRTYPNYVTQEGVLAAEYNKWSARITPTHNVTLPFTRMLVGPMDYTPGGFRNVTKEQFKAQMKESLATSTHAHQEMKAPLVMSTRAHQLAMYVVYESFLQMVSDYPEAYRREPSADFLRIVPASWDETKFLTGEIGEYVCLARRSNHDWFIGAMTNETPRTLQLPLSFLGEAEYSITAYADGEKAATEPRQVAISTKKINSHKTLTVQLAPSGGYAALLKLMKR